MGGVLACRKRGVDLAESMNDSDSEIAHMDEAGAIYVVLQGRDKRRVLKLRGVAADRFREIGKLRSPNVNDIADAPSPRSRTQ